MSVIEHVMSLEQLATIEEMDFEERGERLADLMTENKKLRALTKEMFYSLLNVAAGRRIMTAGEAQNLMVRMNALGVKVDE